MKSIIGPFNKIWAFLVFNLVVAFLTSFIFVNGWKEVPSRLILGTLWSSVIFITQWLGHAYIQNLIGKKFNWMEKTKERILLTFISVPIYAIFAYVIVDSAMNLIFFSQLPGYLSKFDWGAWIIPTFISFFISLFAAAYGFFVSLKKSIVEKETLKREMLSYKYEALRNQINPHFMFNSLNVLSDLVYDDQKLAVKFIHKFSDIYRYVLDSREQELVTLDAEKMFIEKFLFLLKIRFEDKLIFELDLPTKSDDLIVPLSLQLLIENAVKHNEISTLNPLTIRIERITDHILVSNKVKRKNVGEDSKKIGLRNLTQQYSFFSDQAPVINEENEMFCVTIPILKSH